MSASFESRNELMSNSPLPTKERERRKKRWQYKRAQEEYLSGKFSGLKECAAYWGVAYSTLHRYITSDDEKGYVGTGQKLTVLIPEEDWKNVKWFG